MAMHVELLGTGGYYANDRRHTSCILFSDLNLVLDAGSSLYRIAERFQGDELRLFLTHAHLDHIVGLPYLLMPLLLKKLKRVTLYGTEETLAAVQNHLFSIPLFPISVPLLYEPIADSGSLELSPRHTISWQTLPSHPGHSMAYRVDDRENGRRTSVCYVTDTCVDGTYSDFIRETDLLIHECNFPDHQADLAARSGHSIASDVARLAANVQARRLVVVHVDPGSPDEDPIGIPAMRAIYPNVELGVDKARFEVTAVQ